MMAQQEMFSKQVEKLHKDQQDARNRKEEAEEEIKNVRKELSNKLEQER
jgi:predicted transposase YbfD/YdcC